MGGTRSSSKRKSSKRKCSKLSYEARRKNRSRRTKSKKLHHGGDSSSEYSDDSSSVSTSSSSSDNEYMRARSRTRSGVKGNRRKRSRRSSSSHGSAEKKSRPMKKRSGSRRRANFDSKKKSKKKRKREPSVSSICSDSRSFSTCRGGSSSSGDGEFKRPRDKRKERKVLNKLRNATKNDNNRSRSCSPYTGISDSGDHKSSDVQPVENNVRRLRSVITVPKSAEREEKERENDLNKEEIAYDHDDYPSCRSNDSNEGSSKRETASLDIESKRAENVKGGEALLSVSDIVMTECTTTCEEGGVKDSPRNSLSDGSEAKKCSKETKVDTFPTISGANGDDLELVLRLKALENLKKYRGVRLQTSAKPSTDDKITSSFEVKRLSATKVEFVQNSSTNKDDSRVIGAIRVPDESRASKMGRDSSLPATSYGKAQEGQGIVTKRGISRRSLISPPNKLAISGNCKEEDPSPAGNSDLGKSALGQEASKTILNHTHTTSVLVTEGDVDKGSVETCKSVGQTGGDNGSVNSVGEFSISKKSSSTSIKPTLEEQNSKDQQGGQFEQKTMSVMRGGEMVEVSYKVYIPKKAPALARRRLQR